MHWFSSATYNATLAIDLATRQPDNILDVEVPLLLQLLPQAHYGNSEIWDTENLHKLRPVKLNSRDYAEHRQLSKLVSTHTLRALTVWQTATRIGKRAQPL